ncbi:MAG: phage tail protein [Acidobacteriota bacterium]|nr:phage tail protein [Acidobacteriota bacterium]
MPTRNDPLRNFRYRLEIDSITQAGFTEVAIAETTIDAVEYREGTDPPHMRKLSGLTKYGNITLKWGLTVGGTALDLYKWHADVSAGQIKDRRKKVVIVVQDEAGVDAARFVVSEAWPIKYDPSDLSGKGNEVFIELLELANEGIERVM